MVDKVLLIMDYVNELVTGAAGKFNGYTRFMQEHSTLDRVETAISRARTQSIPIVYLRLGFKPDYSDCPEGSPLISGSRKFGILKLGTPSSDFPDRIKPQLDDTVVPKNRISPFYGTNLDQVLRQKGAKTLLLAGVATDLVVKSAAMEGHDRDYSVVVLSDCCAAGSQGAHDAALASMKQFAKVTTLDDALPA